MPADFLNHSHHLLDRMTAAGAKVQRSEGTAGLALQKFRGQRVRFRQIGDVNVIPNAGAVEGGIVVAEYFKVWPQSGSGFQCQGYQTGLGIMEFTDFTAFVRSCRVEVAERNRSQIIGAAIGIEDSLEE